MEQILLYSLLLALSLLVVIRLLTRSRHKNLPPSPFALPILGHLHLLKEPLHRTLSTLSQKYGPVFSLRAGSRFMVVVSSSSAVQECFTRNDIVLANRPHFAMGKYVAYNNTTLVMAPYGDHWRNLRRLATVEIFSSNRLHLSLDFRGDEVKRLLRRLYQVSADSNFAKVELKSMFSELTFNVVMRMISGKRYFGDESNSEEGRKFRKIINELFELAVSSYPGDFVPILRIVDYNGYIKRIKSAGKKLDKLLQDMIDEHRRKKGDLDIKNTMISHLLYLQQSQPDYYTDEIIKGLIQSILAAGTDTTSVTLEWAMSNLLNHPNALEKAKVELNQNVGEEKLVEEADLPKLPYLNNIIFETLRLYPAVPLLVPHMASNNCNIGGYEIPKESTLLVNAWAVQKDPEIWEDATSFKPERFESKEMSDHIYRLIPFGIGRRSCPGMGLANNVLGLTLGSLIQCFEWKRVNEKEIDMTEGQGLSMPKVEPLQLMCKPSQMAKKVLNS